MSFTEEQFKAFCDPEHPKGWKYGAMAVLTWLDPKTNHIHSRAYRYHQYKLAMRRLAKHPTGELRLFKATSYANEV